MSQNLSEESAALAARISPQLAKNELAQVAAELKPEPIEELVETLERLPAKQRAVAYRLLPKQQALEVFESFGPVLQSELIQGLQDAEVAALFEEMDPDDRVWLLDELPAGVAPKLLRGLPKRERKLTSAVLGYPRDSVGRRMSPEYVSAINYMTVGQAMERVRKHLDDAETIYTLPVLDGTRHVVGVVSLRDLMRAAEDTPVVDVMVEAQTAGADEDAEQVARRCANQGLLVMPITDKEGRMVGILTIDDAAKILEHEENEDAARQGGVEPLNRPYLSTPTTTIVRSRVVWLLVLAVGAVFTVQVLASFEATLEQVTVLSLFIPLLIGTGGNTGNQAATTVTRALALGDVTPRDILRVLFKEIKVGFLLGALLGAIGFTVTALVFDVQLASVIGLTLVAICTTAATVGGVMPLIAKGIGADPAVFSNPFISTFVDATGLIIYFLIAKAMLGI